MVKPVKNISFRMATYPDVIKLTNKLAVLENRKPLDALRQLILICAPTRIKELEKQNSSPQSA